MKAAVIGVVVAVLYVVGIYYLLFTGRAGF